MFTQFQEDFNEQKTGFCFVGSTQQSLNSNKPEVSWWKFFHEILQHIQHTNIAKDEYTALCREYYADNECSLRQIEEFENTYTSNAAISWYTRPGFVYLLLNKTLRIKSLNDIFKLRLILTDLVCGLKNARSDDHHQIDSSLRVFRGQPMKIEEIQKMQSEIGYSVVFNSFLSTSKNRDVALTFALGSLSNSSKERVLFTIEIDSDNINNTTTLFADISKHSEYEVEQEVLFLMHSTFRIQSVQLGDFNIWDIRLKFVNNLLDTNFGERSIFSPHVDQIFIRHLSKENKQFIAFQLLLDMILRLDQSEYAKKELLQFCRLKYQDDPIELRKIDDFEENYRSEDAAKWYTKDSFLYRLLNESLRIETIDRIVKMRYYIHDLHNQLAQLQPSFIESLHGQTNLTLYRGQTMKINQLEELKVNFGNFISMNSFVSATEDKQVAFIFSGDGQTTNPDEVSVIYEMLIDTNIRSTPYAKISSVMEDEEEILFSMGPIFHIGKVEKMTDHYGVWSIKLIMEHIEDELWDELTAHLD